VNVTEQDSEVQRQAPPDERPAGGSSYDEIDLLYYTDGAGDA
jgi:hypothetical protein